MPFNDIEYSETLKVCNYVQKMYGYFTFHQVERLSETCFSCRFYKDGGSDLLLFHKVDSGGWSLDQRFINK